MEATVEPPVTPDALFDFGHSPLPLLTIATFFSSVQMQIKLTLYGNHLQRLRVGAAVSTGPEKGGEELMKGKVKKGAEKGPRPGLEQGQ